MLERRGCLLPTRLMHGPTLLGILIAMLIVLIHSQSSQAAQDSYSGLESQYAIYPGWDGLSLEEGLLQLAFRTSNDSGLLLYAEGNEGHGVEALAVMLEQGKISVMVKRYFLDTRFGIHLSQTEQFSMSENLNDNKPHTLSLQRTSGQFTVSVVDRSVSGSSNFFSTSSSIGSMKIYIGGLPSNVMPPFATSGHFRGCLGDVQFVNNSIETSSLVSVLPLVQEGVVEGCSDPCANVSCGGGAAMCVALLPDDHFCGCSSASIIGGADCTEDLSMHRLNQNLDSYLCYALNDFPVINGAGSVRLLDPLPPTGTIMTGVSHSSDQFNLYLDKSFLKLELISVTNGSVKLSTDEALNRSTSYLVNFEVGVNMVELSLLTISGTVIERLNRTLIFPAATFFTTVCVGGTMLEIPYYVGLLEQVVYNAVPLSNRSFVQQYATVETPVNLISFSADYIDPPLTFQRFSFANIQRITFEIRLKKDNSNFGTLILYRNDDLEIQFTIIEAKFTVFLSNPFVGIGCTGTSPVRENVWHRIDLTLIRNGDGTADMSATIDDISCDPLTDSERMDLGMAISSLIDSSAPLQFGYTQKTMMNNMVVPGTKFIGCLQNIEFRETPDSEPIRPDLASAIRSVERFGTGEECHECMEKTVTCTNGEMCVDCGFMYPALCLDSSNSCPDTVPPLPSPTTASITPTPTPTPIFTTTDDLTTSTSTPPTSTPPTSTPPTSTPPTSAQLGMYIGIAIGGAVAIIIIIVILILLLCLCVRVRAGEQGFYKTEESNGKTASMLHYSASLRQIASEQITMAETNGVSPMHADGLRVKEFYM